MLLRALPCTDRLQRVLSLLRFHVGAGMGHSTCPQELQDLRAWLLRVLPDAPPSRDELEGMSAKQLKAFVSSRGGSTYGLLEKAELLEAALKLI